MGENGGSMSVTEELQGSGNWSLTLAYPPQTPYNILRDGLFETLYIVWGSVPTKPTLANLKRISEYAGVVLGGIHDTDSNTLTLHGASLAWWLGDVAKRGPTLGEDFTVEDEENPSDILADIWELADQNPGLILGDVTDPDEDSPNAVWQGTFSGKTTLRQVLDQLATDCHCSWRVNVDGSIDFGPAADLYNVSNPTIINIHPFIPLRLVTRTNGEHLLNKLWLETELAEVEAFVASIVIGYEGADYGQSGIFETQGPSDETSLTESTKALLNSRTTPDDSATITYDVYHRAQEIVQIGDSIDIYDRDALWKNTVKRETILGNLPMKRRVVNAKNWTFDRNMSFYIVYYDSSGNHYIEDLTPWAMVNQTYPTITFMAGDDIDTIYNQIAGSARITTPDVDNIAA